MIFIPASFTACVRRFMGGIVFFVIALTLLGCTNFRRAVPFMPAPPLSSYHDLRPGTPFRRIAVLPLSHEASCGNLPREMDAAFNAELTKTSMFEVVMISRAQMDSIFGREEVSSVETLPGNLLADLGAQFGVDAVLFTDITHYFPYQPISIGVRSKLVDVRSGAIRWAFDYLFDSGKPSVAVAARAFFMGNTQTNLPIKSTGDSILQSPVRFSRYAAWETYRSLVNQPVPAANSSHP